MLCYVMLCYVMLCYVMLCYVMSSYATVQYGDMLHRTKRINQLIYTFYQQNKSK